MELVLVWFFCLRCSVQLGAKSQASRAENHCSTSKLYSPSFPSLLSLEVVMSTLVGRPERGDTALPRPTGLLLPAFFALSTFDGQARQLSCSEQRGRASIWQRFLVRKLHRRTYNLFLISFCSVSSPPTSPSIHHHVPSTSISPINTHINSFIHINSSILINNHSKVQHLDASAHHEDRRHHRRRCRPRCRCTYCTQLQGRHW